MLSMAEQTCGAFVDVGPTRYRKASLHNNTQPSQRKGSSMFCANGPIGRMLMCNVQHQDGKGEAFGLVEAASWKALAPLQSILHD